VITAGLYPNIIVVDTEKRPPKLLTKTGEVFLHPACLDHGAETKLDSKMLVYHELVKTAKVYVRDATTIDPYALLLFGGQIKVQHRSNRIIVDQWLAVASSPKTAVLVKQLRERLDALLERKIDAPHAPLSELDQKVVTSVATLFSTEKAAAPPPSSSGAQPTASLRMQQAAKLKPGDWSCLVTPLQCSQRRIAPAPPRAGGGAVANAIGERAQTCGSQVFASKASCFKCGSGRPGAGPGAQQGGVQPGDWRCPGCAANVFASKPSCFKCGTRRPGGDGRR
jgi:hypothetical protein